VWDAEPSQVMPMRASQFVKLFLGPILAAGVAMIVLARSIRQNPSDATPRLASVALIILMVAGVLANWLARRDRRRKKGRADQNRCARQLRRSDVRLGDRSRRPP
jgi:hypothetical protein